MTRLLKLQEFIVNNPDNWEELLSEKPYALNIKRDGDYIIFVYNMIESDMSNEIVQECRGLILDKWLNAVCVPFFKFFNVQEGNAAQIDWSTARVQEKLDGSIIKLWHDSGVWHVSTNGTIDAGKAKLQMPVDLGVMKAESYFDLFLFAAQKINFTTMGLDEGYTYMFELVSPFNRVVVPYAYTEIFHIGSRNNYTLEEEDLDIGVNKPASYDLSSLEECLDAAYTLPFSEEGYVVTDANWNRVKIKSPAYVAAHHLKNNGVITNARIIELIRANGQDDFTSVYPEYKDMVESILNRIDLFLAVVDRTIKNTPVTASRKELAEYARSTICPSIIFALADGKAESMDSWFWNQSNERILKMIGVAG